jgi:hypothetical protein
MTDETLEVPGIGLLAFDIEHSIDPFDDAESFALLDDGPARVVACSKCQGIHLCKCCPYCDRWPCECAPLSIREVREMRGRARVGPARFRR